MTANDGVAIPLLRRDGSVRAYTLVDEADATWVCQWRWHLNVADGDRLESKGYARRNLSTEEGGGAVYLHKELMGVARGDRSLDVDHLDRDSLNNKRSNLQKVTVVRNCHNRGVRSDNTTGAAGVTYCPDKPKPYRVVFTLAGVKKHLGYFETIEEASAVREAHKQEALAHAQ